MEVDASLVNKLEPETDAERRARTLREWAAVKAGIEGTPATWGINPQTKKPYQRRPYRNDKEVQQTVAEYEAHKGEVRVRGVEYPHEHPFALSTRTTWNPAQQRFHTAFMLKQRSKDTTKCMNVWSDTWSDAVRADAAANACADAHGSATTARAHMARRLEANVVHRARGVATYGDNGALERRELQRLRDHVHRATGRRVRVLICPDGCWADALFRTADMPTGQWLAWQHKTTRKMRIDKIGGQTTYNFDSVLGYTGALVVCSVEEEPNRVWILRGKVLDDHGNWSMKVTKLKRSETVLKVPADNKTLPTEHLDELAAALELECAKVADRAADALPTCTVEEAETRVGRLHAAERAQILAWMRCKHGDPLPWLEMPGAMRDDDDRNLRLLRKKVGEKVVETVVAYPDEQHSKVDLEVLHDWEDVRNGSKTTHQFKSAQQNPGQPGYSVNFATPDGAEADSGGKRLGRNMYKQGDNDVYVVVIPDEVSKHARRGHVDVWEFPEAVLFERGLLATADASRPAKAHSFHVYRNDDAGNPHKHAWTRAYHTAYVKTDYGWLPGTDELEAEINYEIQLCLDKVREKNRAPAAAGTERGVKRARETEDEEESSEDEEVVESGDEFVAS